MVQPQVTSGVAELPPKMRVLVPEGRRLCFGKGRKMSKPPSSHHLKYEFIFKLGRRCSAIINAESLDVTGGYSQIRQCCCLYFILFYFILFYFISFHFILF